MAMLVWILYFPPEVFGGLGRVVEIHTERRICVYLRDYAGFYWALASLMKQ